MPNRPASTAAHRPSVEASPFVGLGRSSWTLLIATVLLLAVYSVY
ncbi:hypothetical protein [Streptomyces sp. TRM70350]|nr:hypothetical protein [Streptomyces sp. TRM70350]